MFSKVITDAPPYASFETTAKIEAIKSIVAKRLVQYPQAICSYSGGSDSDILMHLIEQQRKMLSLPPVKYVFFNTGIEMEATKRHVAEMVELYDTEIETVKPPKSIVTSCREHGIPFVSKIMSQGIEGIMRKNIPFTIYDEYNNADDKIAKRRELSKRYPQSESVINFICCCNTAGDPRPNIQLVINSSEYMLDFLKENPIPFKISSKCCDYCKKKPAEAVQKNFDMVITGERRAEGGQRSVPRKGEQNKTMCFSEMSNGKQRFRPLFYMTNNDKAWYKAQYGLKYSDAYEVYGLKRTGCCGCSISASAVDDLEKIRPYEPNLVKAAYSVFGESYKFRQKYNEYKEKRKAELLVDKNQLTLEDFLE